MFETEYERARRIRMFGHSRPGDYEFEMEHPALFGRVPYGSSYGYPASNAGAVTIDTDGELSVGIGGGFGIDTDGDLTYQVAPGISVDLGGGNDRDDFGGGGFDPW